jgi:hypothetical protein
MMRKIVPKHEQVTVLQVDSPDSLAACLKKGWQIAGKQLIIREIQYEQTKTPMPCAKNTSMVTRTITRKPTAASIRHKHHSSSHELFRDAIRKRSGALGHVLGAGIYLARSDGGKKWIKTQKTYYATQQKTGVLPLPGVFSSAETLTNSIINLGLYDEVSKAVEDLGFSLDDIGEQEQDAALGKRWSGQACRLFHGLHRKP